MSNSIEYNGFLLRPAPRQVEDPAGWSLEVHITPANGEGKRRRCRGRNVYPTRERAEDRCVEFGRQIVDGKLKLVKRGKQ